mmetsp:Transcript_73467/g.129663  ORF Transcript_73467/g.129663 Transcript_73467/m.129663 type:complete len:120 (-) Transcript_73467:48-407(-)|eukprot:CAMPEP_0197656070 /NCGR_PEP_ID=MMETSP1338-20131121/40098_1 /TAXON_ID=43686 ORGANISM="Pelagodinium beii, Strain RCC1491" /NCGR_SAMPLE_ID=MMETSP1338 /ASSEMBLY_ACC=CAM_ASM_000754 /LENGTH=119 /DNA_ID=CAMNT_0043231877 /DNA_START=22 /DNA_END=381 /DNA_ORIENTATION=+
MPLVTQIRECKFAVGFGKSTLKHSPAFSPLGSDLRRTVMLQVEPAAVCERGSHFCPPASSWGEVEPFLAEVKPSRGFLQRSGKASMCKVPSSTLCPGLEARFCQMLEDEKGNNVCTLLI